MRLGSRSGASIALNTSTGAITWHVSLAASQISAQAITGQMENGAISLSRNDGCYALNASDGSVRGRVQMTGALSMRAIPNGMALAFSQAVSEPDEHTIALSV